MDILGIETSCDETAAAIVKDGCQILSGIVASSLEEHKKYGGVIPEIASRRQLELITLTVKRSLERAHLSLSNIDAIAVTINPGLVGSLLVGVSFARALSCALKKPLIEVDHIKAHVYANLLYSKGEKKPIVKLPAIGLVVSGGHSNIFHIKKYNDFDLLGRTRDDAIGEAYDKIARILNLGYPGGPIIDRLASSGENNRIRFACADLPGTLDFSFSGIKTAVLRYVQNNHKILNKNQVAYAFQSKVVSIITGKCIAACRKKNINTLLVGGGVASNSGLRSLLLQETRKHNIKVYFPPISLCTDNAAMIAGFAYNQE